MSNDAYRQAGEEGTATTVPDPRSCETDRVAVLIDYMNAYKGAMQAVGADRSAPGIAGQFSPWSVAQMLAARREERISRPQSLVMVGVYRGMPVASLDSRGASQAYRQVERWRRDAAKLKAPLEIRTRTLAYDDRGRPREKGIDVLLALDLALGAAFDRFSAAVVFSGDADLLPAVEAATGMGVACDSASWLGGGRRLQQPPVEYSYLLSREDYRQVSDSTDYSRKLRSR